jgi:CubicO group peptidase (beta-lactamase class C family)
MLRFASRLMMAALAAAASPAPVRAQPVATPASLTAPASVTQAITSEVLARAPQLTRLHALIVAHDGKPVVERVFRGNGLDRTTNIKSASKSVISALVGIAIDRGVLSGVDQPVVPLLAKRVPEPLDPGTSSISIGHLLSMQAGLERTSGPNYGRWVSSPNWVRYAMTRPFVDQPGGGMLYSTGNTHLLSAILTDATGKSTLDLAREWLGQPLGVAIPAWTRDPQGIYFGGNEMALSPRALLRFGEMYRNLGMLDGKRVVSQDWVRASFTPRVVGRGGQLYGYGWFIGQSEGHPIYYAWGFGGQMVYVVPTLALTVVATSDSTTRSVEDDYRCQLHALVAEGVVPSVTRARPEDTRVALVSNSWAYPPLGGSRCLEASLDGPPG